MITSIQNKQIKNVKALCDHRRTRRQQGLFVVENPRMFKEIPKDMIAETYVSESFLRVEENRSYLEGINYETVKDDVFKKLSDTQNPQGIIALVKQPVYNLDRLLSENKEARYIVLNRLQDPGNLGTILRTAEAAGISAVIMDRECVDVFSPKVVRSTMGAILRVPFVYVENLADALTEMKKAGIKTFAAHLQGKMDFRNADYTKRCAFLIGNEGNGLDKEISNMADELIYIPMQGQAESLNAAVAASLLMYAKML